MVNFIHRIQFANDLNPHLALFQFLIWGIRIGLPSKNSAKISMHLEKIEAGIECFQKVAKDQQLHRRGGKRRNPLNEI